MSGPPAERVGAPDEPREARLKRLRIRSWRRGTREMDLILGAFADARLAELPDGELDAYEAVLVENDQDLYRWVSGAEAPPDRHAPMIGAIARHVADDPAAFDPARGKA